MRFDNTTMNVLAIIMVWLIVLMPMEYAEALSISDVQVSDLTHESATISWTTDESSTGKVEFGTDTPPEETQVDSTESTSHSVQLAGLSPSALHFFQIKAQKDTEEVTDNNGGNYHTFTTDAPPDTTPPRDLIRFNVTSYSKDTVVLDWERDPLDSDVHNYNIYRDGELVATKDHTSYTDMGLSFSTTYDYEAAGVDDADNEGPKSSIQVTTRSENWREIIIPPDTVTVDVIGTNVLISWQTDVATGSSVKFSMDPTSLNQIESISENTTAHNVPLSGLQIFSNYSFTVRSCDQYDNCGESTVREFKTDELIELYLQVDIPRFYSSTRLPIEGRASKGAKVLTYLNGQKHRFTTVGASQEFYMLAQLDPNKDASNPNKIRVEASDAAGGIVTSEEIPVVVDTLPPDVFLDTLPDFSSDSSLAITGNLTDDNYPIEAKFYIFSTEDTTPPPAVTGLINISLEPNRISLSWNVTNDTGLGRESYIIYRTDIGAIGETSGETLTDNNVLTNTEYTYTVAAMDKAGLIGPESAELTLRTPAGGSVDTDAPEKIIPSNPALKKTANLNGGQFDLNLGPLFEEEDNLVKLVFRDQAGNTFEQTKTILYDAHPPQFIEPASLDRYSPSYIRDVTISGKVDDNATIYAFVVNSAHEGAFDPVRAIGELIGAITPTDVPDNLEALPGLENANAFSVATNPDGSFTLPITLTGAPFVVFGGETGGGTSSQGSGRNKVVIYAVDKAGQASDRPLEGYIDYNSCDAGTWWSFKEPPSFTPTYFNPRELTKGYGSISMTYELEWNGGTRDPARIDSVEVTPVFLSTDDQEKYDNAWLTTPSKSVSRDKSLGYFSWGVQPPEQEGDTSNEREMAIGRHRKEECFNEIGTGCMKAFLKMDVRFSSPELSQTANDQGGEPFRGNQVICIPVDIMIGQRLNTSDIPTDLLNFSLQFINAMINVTDALIGPMTKVYQYTFWTCLVGFLGNYIQSARVEWNCRFSNAVQSGSLGGLIKSASGFDKFYSIASQGEEMCTYYAAATAEDSEEIDQIKKACMDCGSQIDNLKWYQNKYHYVCDRVVCPSVPSLQHHIKTSYRIGGKATDGSVAGGSSLNNVDKFVPATEDAMRKGSYAKSDCEYVEKRSRETIKRLAEIYEKGEFKEQCEKPHPYQAVCCPYEYKDIWDPATLLLDPLERSVCFADPKECGIGHSIWEGVTGLCQPGNDGVEFDFDRKLKFKDVGIGQDEKVYIYAKLGADGNLQDVELGQVIDVKRLSGSGPVPAGGSAGNADNKKVVQGLEFTPVVTGLGTHFDQIGDPESEEKADLTAKQQFISSVNSQLGSSIKAHSDNDIAATYDRIADLVGTTEHQYVVQPHAGILETVATVCLSSFVSYLTKWKMILTQYKKCFEAILITGDGTPGMCESLISTEICDLLHSAINCGVNRFRLESQRLDAGGIGNVAGALTGAGERASQSVASRYGDDNVFTNQFSLGNLAHGACMYWFFGEWPNDWKSLMNPNPQVPIASNAVIPVTNRRFHGFNPVDGTTDYVYQVALNLYAGSPVNFRMELYCSGDEKACSENPSGKCDCAHGSVDDSIRTRTVSLSGSDCEPGCTTPLRQNEVCDTECFSTINSGVRYDKVNLCWDWYKEPGASGVQDAEALSDCQDADISEIGRAPGFCNFDLATLSFSCGLDIAGSGFAAIRDFRPTHEPPIYQTGDQSVVTLDIEQRTPEDLRMDSTQDNEGTRYLEIKIVNDLGKQVFPRLGQPAKLHRLNGHTRHDLTFFDPFDFPEFTGDDAFKITPDMFGTAEQTANCYHTAVAKGFVVSQLLCPPANFEGRGHIAVRVVDFGNAPGEHDFKYVEGTYNEGVFKKASGSATLTDNDYTSCEVQPSGYNNQYKARCGPFEIYTTRTYIENQPASDLPTPRTTNSPSIIAYHNPTVQTAGCDSTLHKWTITATVHDGRPKSPEGSGWEPSPQISVDDLGREQSFTKELQVRCQEVTSASGNLNSLVGTLTLTHDNNNQGGVMATGLEYGDSVTIKDFSSKEGIAGKGQGFEVTIDVNVADTNKIIPITFDLSKFRGLMPSPLNLLSVTKNGQTMLPCDETRSSNCFTGSGVLFKLNLKDGDPRFVVTGLETTALRSQRTLKTLGGLSMELNIANQEDYGVKFDNPNPGDKITIGNYRETGSSFSFDISATATNAHFTLDIRKLGFYAQAMKVTKGSEELPGCTSVDMNSGEFTFSDSGTNCVTAFTMGDAIPLEIRTGSTSQVTMTVSGLTKTVTGTGSGAGFDFSDIDTGDFDLDLDDVNGDSTSGTAGSGSGGATPTTSSDQQLTFTGEDCDNVRYFGDTCDSYSRYVDSSPHLQLAGENACNSNVCSPVGGGNCVFDTGTQSCVDA